MKKFFNSPFFRRFGGGIIMLVIAMLIFIGGVIAKGHWDGNLEKMRAATPTQADDAEISETQHEEKVPYADTAWSEATGFNQGRKDYDDRLMSDIFSFATTWHDEASYAEQREKLLAKYPWLNKDDKFLSLFFPSMETMRGFENLNQGSLLNNGSNVTFVSLETDVVSIEDGVYTYIGDLVTQSKGLVGGVADGHTIVEYKTTSDGQAYDITTYVTTKQ